MRIAILGSVALPVPPVYQGGTEWIAYYQAKGLSQRGHKVILFAAAGSAKENGYELVEVGRGDTVAGSKNGMVGFVESSRNLRKENVCLAQVIQKLIDRKDDYDLILNNMRGEAVFLPIAKMLDKPFVNVMHLPIFPELSEIFKQYQTHIITISNAQRKDFPDLNYLATVGNCVDTEKYVFNPKSEDYLLMMGTIGRHKNQGAAIRVAKKLGMKLVLAGKIRDQDYYNELQKDIDGEIIRHVGEVGFEEKLKLYQDAKAFIFPILWPEPFGLVMIEAMACGTPVVAFGNGAILEVVRDGKTGYIINSNDKTQISNQIQNSKFKIQQTGIEGLVEAVKRINGMSEEEYQLLRKNCRKHVEDHFSVEKMVAAYEKALLNI
ncbi:glycosyltransferase family 4 protein [Candidatus Microgenomates bacterium]|nr:glycosyltransferase family 4 protein [Candidatus Microgenomates bacterium]